MTLQALTQRGQRDEQFSDPDSGLKVVDGVDGVDGEERLLLVSAAGSEALEARLASLEALLHQGRYELIDVAHTLLRGRKAMAKRAAVVVPSSWEPRGHSEGPGWLSQRANRGGPLPGPQKSTGAEAGARVALMFPGQGNQFLSMGKGLYPANRSFASILDRCAKLLEPRLELDLRELLFESEPGDEAATKLLEQTRVQQPALFVVEYALGRMLLDAGVAPSHLLGHSIGEYAAACLAGVFNLEAALVLVSERGRLMQSMPAGSMLAVFAPPDELSEYIHGSVGLAAHNSPELSVLSGPAEDIESVESRLIERDVSTRRLPTSHAFHSAMMDPILAEFEEQVKLAAPQPPRIHIVSTVTGRLLSAAEATSSSYWAQQLRRTVQFVKASRTALEHGVGLFVEVGPGLSLSSAVSRLNDATTEGSPRCIATLGHPQAAVPAHDAFLSTLGELWVAGIPLNWDALLPPERRKLVRLGAYPYTRRRHFVEPPSAAESGATPGNSILERIERNGTKPREGAAATLPRRDERLFHLIGERLGTALVSSDRDRRFLELGFDSLGLSQLGARIRQGFGVRVPVRSLFEGLHTPGLLLAHLDSELPADEAPNDASPEEPTPTPAHPGPAPLTPPQREIWLSVRLGGAAASIAYNECRAFRFRGPLDEGRLVACLARLVERHEALRHTFSLDGEACRTGPSYTVPLRRLDLRSQSEGERQANLAEARSYEVATPFDLENGPCLRGALVRLTDEESELVLCAHHICVDGSSWEVLIRELSTLYRDTGEGDPQGPADSFAAYSARTLSASFQRDKDRAQAYWLERLRGQSEDLDLPTDRSRTSVRSPEASRLDGLLPEALALRLRQKAKEWSCTSQTLLLTTYALLLQRLSRQDDLICGIPTSGQAQAGAQSLVGHCVQVLPVRLQLDVHASARGMVSSVHTAMLDALDHQETSYGELLGALKRPRDPSRPALIQAAFGMGRSQKRPDFGGLECAVQVVPRQSETFELYVWATESGDSLELSWSYATSLFSAETIALWQRCFERLLASLLDAEPEAPVGQLALLADEDRIAVIERACGPAVELPDSPRVIDQFVDCVRAHPQRTAFICEGKSVSYKELDALSSRIAHFIASQGIAPGSVVAVCLRRQVELVATLLAVWKAGLGYVPLDPQYPTHRVADILEDSRAALVITTSDLSSRLPVSLALYLDEVTGELARLPTTMPRLSGAVDRSDTAYVIFTSGSTGRPKGVTISQGAMLNFIQAMRTKPGLEPADRILALTTISFDISVLELFLPLSTGSSFVLVTESQARDPRELIQLIDEREITVVQATPATWQMLFQAGWKGKESLKVLCGGEAFPQHLAAEFLQTCGSVFNVYGPTETTVWSTVKKLESSDDVTIGRPIDNTTLYVLDEFRALVPQGARGELWIGGAGVADGYIGRLDLTSERFVDSPYRPGERIYRTGDLARMRADGQFECLGRTDFQVKIRGFRIELGEVESALIQEPSVRTAVVVPHEVREGERVLAAYVVAEPGRVVDRNALRQALTSKLPAYMVPSLFTVLDSLPMTPNKKVDRKALPPPGHDSPLPPPSSRSPRQSARPAVGLSSPTPARTETEVKLLPIWSEVLQHSSLGVEDDYYAAGGHSLTAIRLVDRVNKVLETDLSVNDIFTHPTVASLAREIDSRFADDAAPVSRAAIRRPEDGLHKGLFLVRGGSPARIPLLLIHGDQANSMLPPLLDREQEIWGYHHQGSEGEELAMTHVSDIAARVHLEWKTAFGNRPCIGAGHSFGALVAFEAACIREREGLSTPRLVMIDSRHPAALDGHTAGLGREGLKARLASYKHRLHAKRRVAAARAFVDRGQTVPTNLRNGYVLGTYRLAAGSYEPGQYFGEVDVIRSGEFAGTTPNDHWETSVRGPLRRVQVEGTHLGLVRERKGVEGVAMWLRRIISEVQRLH